MQDLIRADAGSVEDDEIMGCKPVDASRFHNTEVFVCVHDRHLAELGEALIHVIDALYGDPVFFGDLSFLGGPVHQHIVTRFKQIEIYEINTVLAAVDRGRHILCGGLAVP